MVYGSQPKHECFLIANTTWCDEKGKQRQRVMLFAKPGGLAALSHKKLNLHFDGTFKVTPKNFYQTCILGSRDHGSNKHVPCVYALLTTKTQVAYETMFHHVKMAVGEYSFFRQSNNILLR